MNRSAGNSQIVMEPTGRQIDVIVERRMTRRHEVAQTIWPQWCKYYPKPDGLKVSVCREDPDFQGPQKPTRGPDLKNFGFDAIKRTTEVLGFLDYWIQQSGSINWYACKYSLLSSGKAVTREKSRAFPDKLKALHQCYAWEMEELSGMEVRQTGSFSELGVLPIACAAVSNNTLTTAVDAKLSLEKSLYPHSFRLYQQIDAAKTADEYNDLVRQIPNAELLDYVAIYGDVPPGGPDVPRRLIKPIIKLQRKGERRSEKTLLERYVYYEVATGWVRRGYCFLSREELHQLIVAKTKTTMTLTAFSKRLYELELISLKRDKSSSIDF